jgi:alkylation response protein AidB-like acyl-CoA dehydrogenase
VPDVGDWIEQAPIPRELTSDLRPLNALGTHVQASLAMFAIHRWGSEAQKQKWLPRMAGGEAIG